MTTRSARPILASQAAIGRMTSAKKRLESEEKRAVRRRERAKASRISKARRNCFR